MAKEKLIELEKLSLHYELEISFFHTLHEHGLIELIVVEDTHYIESDQLTDLERCLRLHRELEINLHGIGAITHLLRRNEELHRELVELRNALKKYER